MKHIDRGLASVHDEQAAVRAEVEKLRPVAETLDRATGSVDSRRERFEKLREAYATSSDSFAIHLAKVMLSFVAGLFVSSLETLPRDNLELERWFRLPKGHARRIHGRCHAGTRCVRDGPTLACALDAHLQHLGPFTTKELLPYRDAQPPPSQQAASARHTIMRRARSTKQRPVLLAELERRYQTTT